MASDLFTDILVAAAEAHRAHEVHSRLDDLLVDGRLLLTEAALATLKRDAAVTPEDAAESLPPWALISVLAIPDDGAPHDIGAGKVAMVNPFDHRTILAMPAELVPPVHPPVHLAPDDRYPLL